MSAIPLPSSLPRRLPRPKTRPRRSKSLTRDRKSTRLNSSHSQISYAVFCLKKKNDVPDLVHIEGETVSVQQPKSYQQRVLILPRQAESPVTLDDYDHARGMEPLQGCV